MMDKEMQPTVTARLERLRETTLETLTESSLEGGAAGAVRGN